MKVGLFVFQSDTSADPAILAKKAEEVGFESFWVPEHILIPVHSTSPAYRRSEAEGIPEPYAHIVDPFVSLARASAVTTTIKLGTAICLVPEHNPLDLAKQVATLDHVSGGRFIFGIGAGWLREETEIMGGDFPHRWTQTRESIEAMKELWTKDEAEYHGRYYDFPPVRSFPKPIQKPHPPIFLGGSAKNVFKRTVEWADGWMPALPSLEELSNGRAAINELAAKAGRDPSTIDILAFGRPGQFRDREAIKDLENAGATRVTIWIEQTEGDAAIAEIELLAQQALS